jgi:5'-nucleotidase
VTDLTASASASAPVILVTNDDGIDSPGLHAVVEALAPLGRIIVVAPDRNRSGVSRSITLGEVLQVTEERVAHAEVALATDGTPTDCVRMAVLGLAGPRPDIVVSGANLGLNVGDDIAYSGTVSAAFDAALNGLPAVAVSQQSIALELGYPRNAKYDFRGMQRILPGIVAQVLRDRARLPEGLVLNINVPGCPPDDLGGFEIGVPGRRIYRDKLELQKEEGGRRHFALYGDDPEHHADEEGTDIAAIGRGNIAITPLRFNAADVATAVVIDSWNLDALLG